MAKALSTEGFIESNKAIHFLLLNILELLEKFVEVFESSWNHLETKKEGLLAFFERFLAFF